MRTSTRATHTPALILLKIYLLAMLCFTLFRGVLLSLNLGQVLEQIPTGQRFTLVLGAFVMGLRFDTVVCCYLLFVPLILMLVNAFFRKEMLGTLQQVYLKVIFLFAFFLCSVDIPYFMFHSVRLSKATFGWLAETPGFVISMVFSEPRFWLVGLAPLVLISALFLWGLRRWVPIVERRQVHFLAFIPLLLLLVVGSRGRLSFKSPIRTGTAFFSSHSFINLLGLNPVFTFTNSLKQKQSAPLIDSAQALANMRHFYQVDAQTKAFSRAISFKESRKPLNVVVVIMESMAAKKTGFLHGMNLTPNLDGLAKRSLSFNNAYTLGIHTFNGIYSTLFSLSSAFGEHPMKVFPLPKLGGLATSLKRYGYSTNFFIPHDAEFDNIAGFLTNNDFDHVMGESFYPKEKVLSTLGVPDHVMFDESIAYLNQQREPFLAVYMTASDHGPYVVPTDIPFKPQATDKRQRTTQYADWAIGKFIRDAEAQPWFKNTLFVFVADHGAPLQDVYDISLNYHHTPLLFFMPSELKPQSSDDLISQMDIFPTIMGILRAPYTHDSLGLDVRATKRTMIPINNEDVLGAIGEKYLYVYRKDGDSLYEWRDSKLENLKDLLPEVLLQMKTYSLSSFQLGRDLATKPPH